MIFNLFKSKPTLKELIPNGFVDIHSHILPGIDDGAKNFEESIHLIKEMKKLGFSKIIGTPHTYPGLYENTAESIIKSFNSLNKNKPDDIKISYASEYMLDVSLIAKAEDKSIVCLKDNFILVEFGFLDTPPNVFDIIYNLRLNNYVPILAHPERYLYKSNDLDFFKKIKKHGCYLQLNLFSLTGYYGKEVNKLANKLLKNNFIDFVGSDIHNKRQIKNFEYNVTVDKISKIEQAINKTLLFN